MGNYRSLKAYAVTAESKINNYVIKGKGRNLSSLGDLLVSIASLSAVKVHKAEGIGAGASSVPAIFSASSIKVDDSVNKINGLANGYTGVAAAVRARWSMGLGKYLLMKAEQSMLGKGVLQVDKLSDKTGNFVFVNGHAVGLSNKLNDFEATLAKLTAALSAKAKPPPIVKPLYVKPPEW